jgi:hypothetical protein
VLNFVLALDEDEDVDPELAPVEQALSARETARAPAMAMAVRGLNMRELPISRTERQGEIAAQGGDLWHSRIGCEPVESGSTDGKNAERGCRRDRDVLRSHPKNANYFATD